MWALCGRLQFVDASLPQPLFYNFGWQLKTSASCIHADGGKIYLVRRNKLASSIDAIAVSEIWNYEWVNDPLTAPKIFDKKTSNWFNTGSKLKKTQKSFTMHGRRLFWQFKFLNWYYICDEDENAGYFAMFTNGKRTVGFQGTLTRKGGGGTCYDEPSLPRSTLFFILYSHPTV